MSIPARTWVIYPWVKGSSNIRFIHPDDLHLVEKGIGIAFCIGPENEYDILDVFGKKIRVREMPNMQQVHEPRFKPGDQVCETGRPDVCGLIESVGWHSKHNAFFYYLRVNHKIKSRRYAESELQAVSI